MSIDDAEISVVVIYLKTIFGDNAKLAANLIAKLSDSVRQGIDYWSLNFKERRVVDRMIEHNIASRTINTIRFNAVN